MTHSSRHITAAKESVARQFRNNIGNLKFSNNTGAAFTQNKFNAGGPVSFNTPSQPYILQITSTSSATATSIELFGANTHLSGYGTFVNGSLTNGGITVSSAFSNTTYQGLLYQSMTNSFMVGTTRLKLVSGSVLPDNINWNNTDQGSGNANTGSLTLPLSDFQQISSQVTSTDAYPMNGNTTLTIDIQPGTTLKLWVYPQVVVDPSQASVGDAPVQNYKSADINRAGTFNVKA